MVRLTINATFFLLDYCYEHYRLFEISNVWLYWIVLILAQDLLYWLLHTTAIRYTLVKVSRP